jgi:hypothetical protein
MVLKQLPPRRYARAAAPVTLVPHSRSLASEYTVISSREVVASRAEMRGDNAVDLDEPLGMLSGQNRRMRLSRSRVG